jgi:hypothetical protein
MSPVTQDRLRDPLAIARVSRNPLAIGDTSLASCDHALWATRARRRNEERQTAACASRERRAYERVHAKA